MRCCWHSPCWQRIVVVVHIHTEHGGDMKDVLKRLVNVEGSVASIRRAHLYDCAVREGRWLKESG